MLRKVIGVLIVANKRNSCTTFIVVIVTLCLFFSGCSYTKDNSNLNSNGSKNHPTTIARKSYTEEEFVSFSDHNKFPKSYLIKVGDGDCFTIDHFDNNGNNKPVTVTFNKVSKYSNISEFDKNNFANYKDDIAPYVDKKGNLKSYKRTTKKLINGGLDKKFVSVNKNAQREFVVLDVEIRNTSDKKQEGISTYQLGFGRYKSLDDEFVSNELNNYEFTDEKDNLEFSDSNIYFTKSKYKNVKNVNKRMMNFYSYTLKPNETLKCQVGFMIDKDLEDAMIIMPTTGTPLHLQVFK